MAMGNMIPACVNKLEIKRDMATQSEDEAVC